MGSIMPSADREILSLTDLMAASDALEQSGDISRALKRANQALALARDSEVPEDIAAALVRTARIQYHLGHFERANALGMEALEHATPDSQARAEALRILGNCAHEAGELPAAETFFHQAIDIARSQGYQQMLQSCLHSLSACIYQPRGQFELALAADEEALRLAVELELHKLIWFPLARVGWTFGSTRQRGRGRGALERMMAVVQPGSMAEGYYLCLCADLVMDGESPASAFEYLTRARSIAEQVGDPGLNAEVRLGFSRCERKLGNAPAAYTWADDALGTAHRAGSSDLQGIALIERALACWAVGNAGNAEADLKASGEILGPLQANYDLARIGFYLAALYQQQARPEAEPAWVDAVNRIERGGYTFLLERERSLAFPLLAHYLNSRSPRVSALAEQLLAQLANVPPPPLRIATLGRFEVRQGQQVIPEQSWRQRKAGELFRWLLIRPRHTALRDQVIQDLWPDKSPAAVQALFHQATSSLRKALEPDLPEKFPSRYLSVEQGEIRLHLPEGSLVDFETFEQHIADQDWQAALEAFQGDLFPGDMYSDWAVEKREQLKQDAVRASLGAAQQAMQAGDAPRALTACQLALKLEPWEEGAVLLGMQACMAQNDRSGAIRLYQKLERALKEELDVAPQEVVQAYYRKVINR